MTNDKYKRSRLSRYSWLTLSVFFIIFCSCPVKRYIKFELYKGGAPVESVPVNAAFSKELKDCNLIDKQGVVQVVRFSEVARPKPQTVGSRTVVALFLATILPEELISFFNRTNKPFYYHNESRRINGSMPLYLKCSRLQV